jgi:hypothetical protein
MHSASSAFAVATKHNVATTTNKIEYQEISLKNVPHARNNNDPYIG